MSDLPVTVVIPVGPLPQHVRWLDEAIQSVREQTYPQEHIQVLLVDDMQGFFAPPDATVWRSPWHLGVAAAFNAGVALAEHPLVFMLGSDDRLLPKCLEQCIRAYEDTERRDLTYFAVPVEYSDGRDVQRAPCNAALVSKALWRQCGGFPIESASGAPDAALMSIFMKHPEAGQYLVIGDKPLYWYRVHEGTDTASRAPWQGVVLETRHLLTQLWQSPDWEALKRKEPSYA